MQIAYWTACQTVCDVIATQRMDATKGCNSSSKASYDYYNQSETYDAKIEDRSEEFVGQPGQLAPEGCPCPRFAMPLPQWIGCRSTRFSDSMSKAQVLSDTRGRIVTYIKWSFALSGTCSAARH